MASTSLSPAANHISIVDGSTSSSCPVAYPRDKMSMISTESNANNNNNETMSSNLQLEEKLNSARVDAKETLLALLQFSEGVRVITRHMQSATTTTTDSESDNEEEECKSQEEDNPFLTIERMVSDTRLQGTVFGTDLLRLWDAAHHVRDYARLVTEESTVSSNDIVTAQRVAKSALQRAKKAETLALALHRKNEDLSRQLDQVSAQKKCLVQEVKTLRQQVASTRKMDMERLLHQHVAGAILLHEEQLKAMANASAAAQQHQKQQMQERRKIAREEEEEKKEDDSHSEIVVVVSAEDCEEAGFVGGTKKALASPKRNSEKRTISIPSSPSRDEEEKCNHNKPTEVTQVANMENNPAAPTQAETEPCDASAKDTSSVATEPQSTPSTPSSSYSPVRLFPNLGRLSPPPPPFPNADANKPSSTRSVASEQSNHSTSVIEPPPEQPRQNVGSKVFNFLFHPEKIAQQKVEEMKQQQRQGPKREEPPKHKRPNALLALHDLVMDENGKEDASVDATAPTQAATTPGSTCSLRARSMSGDKLAMATTTKIHNNKSKDSQKHSYAHNNNSNHNNVIPNCVSFSDDTQSVQSNLPSPKFQTSSRRSVAVEDGNDTDEDSNDNSTPQDVELYKDFKMFRSLAIPNDDEIDEYHQSRDQELRQ